MVKRSLVALVVLVLLLSGCAARANTPSLSTGNDATENQKISGISPNTVPGSPLPSAADSRQYNTGSETSAGAGAQRLVIMNATLSIVVVDPGKTLDFVTGLAAEMQGFVVSSNLYKTTNSSGVELPAANVTIRVPADKLNDAMAQIKNQVKDQKTDVRSENVSGQDVTKEYTDLQSQLANLQQAEKQLQQIMDSAVKVDDVLNVFNQLTQIQSQIQVLQGQIKYYSEAAAMSAISVDIIAEASVEPLTIGGWEPVGVARDAIQTLINGLQLLGNAAIWGVLFCVPIFVVVAIPIWLIWYFVRRWRKSHRPGQQLPESTPPAA